MFRTVLYSRAVGALNKARVDDGPTRLIETYLTEGVVSGGVVAGWTDGLPGFGFLPPYKVVAQHCRRCLQGWSSTEEAKDGSVVEEVVVRVGGVGDEGAQQRDLKELIFCGVWRSRRWHF